MVRRTANGACEQVRDAFLKNLIFWYADRVQEALSLHELVHLQRGEGGIGTEVAPQLPVSVSVDDRHQHLAPAIGAVNVTGAQGTPFKVAELVEAKERVVARAAEMPIVMGRSKKF